MVSGYIRMKKWQNILNIPDEIIKLIEEFYPIAIEFEGSRLKLTFEEKEYLTQYLMQTLMEQDDDSKCLSAVLLYDGEKDGMEAKAFHKKCDFNENTLTLVETEYDHIFGCFSSVAFEQKLGEWQKDLKSFLCLIRTQFEITECPKYCRYVSKAEKPNEIYGDRAAYSGSNYGPCFGHSFDVGIFSPWGHANYVNHTKYTNYPDAFGNMLCGGKKLERTEDINKKVNERSGGCKFKFDIKHVETYRIDIK